MQYHLLAHGLAHELAAFSDYFVLTLARNSSAARDLNRILHLESTFPLIRFGFAVKNLVRKCNLRIAAQLVHE